MNVPLTVYRVYATGIDQGGLDPEINRSFELGYLWQPATPVSLDVRLFQDNISDLIRGYYRQAPALLTALPDHQVLDFQNDQDVRMRGVEVQFTGTLGTKTRLFASYAFTDVDSDDSNTNASAPQHGFALLINQELGSGWQISLNYNYQSAMTWYLEDPIAHYHILDMRLAKRIKVGNTRIFSKSHGNEASVTG